MAIKTLIELQAESKVMYENHKQIVAEAAAQLESVKAAKVQAEKDMQAALVSGNSQAYANAQAALEYNIAKYDQLFNLPSQPLRTPEEYTEYRRQLDLAKGTELKPLYEQLQTAFNTCKGIVPQIKALLDLYNSASHNFKGTIPNDAKYGSDNEYWMSMIFGLGESVYGDIGNVFKDSSGVDRSINDAIANCSNLIETNTKE